MLRRLCVAITLVLAAPLFLATTSASPTVSDAITPSPSLPPEDDGDVIWLSSLYGDPDNPPHQTALDTQTGQVVFEAAPPFERKWTSPDGRWQYFLEPSWTSIRMWVFDRGRGAFTRAFDLAPYGLPASGDAVPHVELEFSKDGRTIAAVVRMRLQAADTWQNDVSFIDTATSRVLSPMGLGVREGQHPWTRFRPFLSDDGKTLAVLETFMPNPVQAVTEAAKPRRTLWLMNTTERRWRAMIDLLKETRTKEAPESRIGSPHIFFSRDGGTIYYVDVGIYGQPINTVRLLAIDVSTRQTRYSNTFEAPANESAGGCSDDVRLTSDERAIVFQCRRESSHEPAEVFHFVSTNPPASNGQVVVPWKVAPEVMWGQAQLSWSADRRTIYVLNPDTQELAKVDVNQRAVVARAALNRANAAPNLLQRLGAMFVQRAQAKSFGPSAPLMLSPDEKRLYALQSDGREAAKGIWVVDTTTLNVTGLWLAGETIYDARLSANGRELFAIAGDRQALVVLDAMNGGKLREFPNQWGSAFMLD